MVLVSIEKCTLDAYPGNLVYPDLPTYAGLTWRLGEGAVTGSLPALSARIYWTTQFIRVQIVYQECSGRTPKWNPIHNTSPLGRSTRTFDTKGTLLNASLSSLINSGTKVDWRILRFGPFCRGVSDWGDDLNLPSAPE
ncbi:hypothetical protein V2G26_016112 [Clonostachys chloroleuca]